MNWFQNKRIVVPFDFSDDSRRAVEVASTMTSNSEHLHVIHVLPQLLVSDPGVIWETVDDETRKAHARAEMVKRLGDSIQDDMHLDIGIGDPGQVIVDLAEEINAGLIVIPSHGRTGISRLILGSVAERVVRLAKCPVLVLKHDWIMESN
jgi:nucleotide-binding universal stress UspA family protein